MYCYPVIVPGWETAWSTRCYDFSLTPKTSFCMVLAQRPTKDSPIFYDHGHASFPHFGRVKSKMELQKLVLLVACVLCSLLVLSSVSVTSAEPAGFFSSANRKSSNQGKGLRGWLSKIFKPKSSRSSYPAASTYYKSTKRSHSKEGVDLDGRPIYGRGKIIPAGHGVGEDGYPKFGPHKYVNYPRRYGYGGNPYTKNREGYPGTQPMGKGVGRYYFMGRIAPDAEDTAAP